MMEKKDVQSETYNQVVFLTAEHMEVIRLLTRSNNSIAGWFEIIVILNALTFLISLFSLYLKF